MKRKGIARLSAGYILMFSQILLLFHYQGAKNPLTLIIKNLTYQNNPVLFYIGLFMVGAVGLALAIWGGIDYKKSASFQAPKDLSKSVDKYRDAKGREYFYDNAKFILIFLVVAGHAISPFSEMRDLTMHYPFLLLWRMINTLHMPCFIFISGFLAKKYIGADGSINVQRPFTYIVYYLVAQFTVGAFEVFVLGDSISKSVLSPRSSLWFLVCLIWWYLLLPVIDKIDPRIMLPVAIAVGLLIGYDDKVNNTMAISRMIVHFPFFISGYYISSGQMRLLFTKKAKLISIPVFVAVIATQLIVLYLFRPDGQFTFSINSFLTCDRSYYKIYSDHGVSPLFWFLPRVWFYVSAALLGFVFLVWVPKRKTFFTVFGARTLAPYILHRYLYLAYRPFKWYTLSFLGINIEPEYAGLIMIGVSFALTLILSLYPFYLPFELLGRIKVKPFLKKPKEVSAK